MNAINNLIEIRVLNKRLFFKNTFSEVYEKKKNIKKSKEISDLKHDKDQI